MAFDKGKPIAGRKARYIDDDIRANNEAIEAAVGFGHDFATGSTQTGEHNDGAAKIYAGDTAPTTKEDGIRALNADDVGKRLWLDTSVTPNVLKVLTAIGTPNTWTAIGHLAGDTVRLSESASDPAAVENIGFIYTKAANSKTELFMRLDAGGSVVQLTKNALLYLNNAKLDNDTYLKARNAAGNGDVGLIKAGSRGVPVLAAGAELAATAHGNSPDLAIINKSYLASEKNDLIGAGVLKNAATTYTAEASGVLVVRATITWIHNVATYVSVLSDDNATPTTEVGVIGGRCTRGDSAQNILYLTCSVPIVKGKKYRVTATERGAVADRIIWYPNE